LSLGLGLFWGDWIIRPNSNHWIVLAADKSLWKVRAVIIPGASDLQCFCPHNLLVVIAVADVACLLVNIKS